MTEQMVGFVRRGDAVLSIRLQKSCGKSNSRLAAVQALHLLDVKSTLTLAGRLAG